MAAIKHHGIKRNNAVRDQKTAEDFGDSGKDLHLPLVHKVETTFINFEHLLVHGAAFLEKASKGEHQKAFLKTLISGGSIMTAICMFNFGYKYMYVKVEGFAPESSLCTSLAQGGASLFWGCIWYFKTRHSLGEKGSQYVGKNTFGSFNSWLALLPFAVGAFSLYILNMLALDYMSPASFTAVYMSKLVVDMLFGWVLFGSRISVEAMLAVAVIGVNTVVHVQTLGPSDSNSDPVMGCIWTFAYVMSAAVSCTYLSWLSKHQSYPAILLMFISSVEQSIGGLIMYILTRAASGTMAGAFDTLQQGEIWLLVFMIAIADAGYFFACIIFSSQGLTLITAMMIPLGYIFEILALEGNFDLVPAISGLCIGFGVIQKVRIHEADNKEEEPAPKAEAQTEDKDNTAGKGGKVEEKETPQPGRGVSPEGLELQEGEAKEGEAQP